MLEIIIVRPFCIVTYFMVEKCCRVVVVRWQHTVRWIARTESPSQGRLTGFVCWLFNIIAAWNVSWSYIYENVVTKSYWTTRSWIWFFFVWNVVGHWLLLPIYNASYVTHFEFCFTMIWESVYSPVYSKNCHEQNILLLCFLGVFTDLCQAAS